MKLSLLPAHRAPSALSLDLAPTLVRLVGGCLQASQLGLRLDVGRLEASLRRHIGRWLRPGSTPRLDLSELYDRFGASGEHATEDLYVPFANMAHLLAEVGVEAGLPERFGERPGEIERREAAMDETRALLAAPKTPRSGVRSVGSLLLAARAVEPALLERALAVQARAGGRIGGLLRQMGALDDAALAEALGKLHGVAFAHDPSPAKMDRSARTATESYPILPLPGGRDGWSRVAVGDPAAPGLVLCLERALGRRAVPVVVPQHQLDRARARLLGRPFPERWLGPLDEEDRPTELGRALDPGIELSAFGRALADATSAEEVVSTAFSLWSAQFTSSASVRIEGDQLVGVQGRGLSRPAESAKLPAGDQPLFRQALLQRRAGLGEGGYWLVERLGFAARIPVAVVPLADPRGAVRWMLIGQGPKVAVDPATLDGLRARLAAALRLTEARAELLEEPVNAGAPRR